MKKLLALAILALPLAACGTTSMTTVASVGPDGQVRYEQVPTSRLSAPAPAQSLSDYSTIQVFTPRV